MGQYLVKMFNDALYEQGKENLLKLINLWTGKMFLFGFKMQNVILAYRNKAK